MGNFLREALKDKNKLLMLVPLLLGVLFVIVSLVKKKNRLNQHPIQKK